MLLQHCRKATTVALRQRKRQAIELSHAPEVDYR